MVCDLAQRREFSADEPDGPRVHLDLAPGRDPIGEERS
jgi:hypothetical protein